MSTIIGQVAVKVIPDTSTFKEETRAALAGFDPTVKIDFEADIVDAIEEARHAVDAAEESVKGRKIKLRLDVENARDVESAIRRVDEELAALSRDTLEVQVDRDSLLEARGLLEDFKSEVSQISLAVDYDNDSSIRRALATIDGELSKLSEVDLTFGADKSSLLAARAELEQVMQDKVNIEIQADNEQFAKVREAVRVALGNLEVHPNVDPLFVQRARRAIDDATSKIEELKLELKPELSEREKHRIKQEISDLEAKIGVTLEELSLRSTQARLSYLARTRFAEIAPVVNKAAAAKAAGSLAALSGGRAVLNIGTNFNDFISDLDRTLPKVGTLTLAVTNLGSAILSATSNTFSLGASLGSIGGAGLALPGIFGGLAIGVGATVAVLKDINEVLPNLGQRFHDLQDSMSVNFWEQAKVPFQGFINDIFPQFAAGMDSTSTSLGTFFAQLANSATGVFDGELQSMFADLSKSIEVSSEYTDNFIGIIEKLGSVGAGNLPRLAGWVGDVAEQFDGWLTDKGESGLQDFVDEGIVALQDLGGVLKASGSLFAGLSRAANEAGGSTLASLRKTLEGAAEVVNGAQFQDALVTALTGANQAMDNLTNGAGASFKSFLLELSDTLGTVLPIAGEAAGEALGAIFDALGQDSVQTALVTVFEALESAISNVAPAMPAVADGLAAIATVAASVGDNVSRSLAPALEAVSDAAVDLAPNLLPLVDQLGDLLANAVNGSAPILGDLVVVIGDLAGVLAAVLEPINALASAFGALPGPVQEVLSGLTAVTLVAGASTFFGASIVSKIAAVGASLTAMSTEAAIGSRALGTAGIAAQSVAQRMTKAKLGLAGLGFAIGTLGEQAAGGNKALSTLATAGGGSPHRLLGRWSHRCRDRCWCRRALRALAGF